ncbi:16S rRNA (guanine(527)-N(7))-methyltransferase RsmG [Robbsia sp. KACC 23696]|uniref:16S rRNA (guanine(527)-N(7))-methyltransferase RsmG n=1 Tax=Robbsia sp. KACC 23696 TaxID=3149231 RepID=UPI00325B1D63
MGISVDDVQAENLAAYIGLLSKWNRVYNLTAIRDPEQMRVQHVLDSLSLLPHLDAARVGSVIDVGTGGGTPGLILAIMRPDWRITLNDIVQKKIAFLTQVKSTLQLGNVEVINARVEEVKSETGFDAVTSRAFADLSDFARWAGHLVAPEGAMYAMKGLQPDDEIARLPAGAAVRAITPLTVPHLAAERHLVVVTFASPESIISEASR